MVVCIVVESRTGKGSRPGLQQGWGSWNEAGASNSEMSLSYWENRPGRKTSRTHKPQSKPQMISKNLTVGNDLRLERLGFRSKKPIHPFPGNSAIASKGTVTNHEQTRVSVTVFRAGSVPSQGWASGLLSGVCYVPFL